MPSKTTLSPLNPNVLVAAERSLAELERPRTEGSKPAEQGAFRRRVTDAEIQSMRRQCERSGDWEPWRKLLEEAEPPPVPEADPVVVELVALREEAQRTGDWSAWKAKVAELSPKGAVGHTSRNTPRVAV